MIYWCPGFHIYRFRNWAERNIRGISENRSFLKHGYVDFDMFYQASIKHEIDPIKSLFLVAI